ncbi:Virulence factor Mce family protein [uncultured Mycobacterium sp.]|uniref:Virulence factor Mce family protein n=1 Tax=uncultured Mycobacterium sp. TaxID=171292 RepID=A0A1Y5PK06_9MYCO|nr:Virulence factor Mce family protein [uncultured Mycobacterium sp.]
MNLTKRIRLQLILFAVVSLVALAVMGFSYMKLPNLLFGIGHYTVTVELPETGGLYTSANVTYRGVEVGRVKDVQLTDNGVSAVLSLRSDVTIPRDLNAEVHSQSAVGEQYVALLPRSDNAPPLRNGDVIARANSSVPPDINVLLNQTNTGLEAIPQGNLKTVIDEGYTAVGGLGPDLSRFIKGSTALAIDARKNIDAITTLIDGTKPVLDTQTDTSDSVHAWASHLADLTGQLKANDAAVRGVLQKGGDAAEQGRQLLDRLQPTLPIIMANLASLGNLALTYNPAIEQLLVLFPQATMWNSATAVPNLNTKQAYKGIWSSFNLNLNLPPPCTTGYLPASQIRAPALQDRPPRPTGDLYCRVPQDSPFNVRGVRNTPCMTKPGKRAPTAKMCNSDEEYRPINDGYNWKGDPNATLSGQDIPQYAPGTAPAAPPPIAAAPYDPATGTYVGPDGHVYTQSDLAQSTPKNQTWQSMLLPPGAS